MKSIPLFVLAAMALAACADPVAEQAASRCALHAEPRRSDGGVRLRAGQRAARSVAGRPGAGPGRRAARPARRVRRRDRRHRAGRSSRAAPRMSRSRLSQAGARWVTASVEPSMARGPDQVVVVRSEYRIGMRNCPTYTPSSIWNPNELDMPGFGCADAYNMGQMLARPRDAAVGRSPGPADGQVSADAVQRYREGACDSGQLPVAVGGAGGAGGGGGGRRRRRRRRAIDTGILRENHGRNRCRSARRRREPIHLRDGLRHRFGGAGAGFPATCSG